MDYHKIKTALTKFPEAEITRYINYLKFLETATDKNNVLKNSWFGYLKEVQLIDLYTNVAIDSLSIDGETITIQFKGKVMVSYNYQAYKNRLLNVYPESLFDIQLVCEGDDFSFRKECGKVIYSHTLGDPFKNEKNIIGTYCIIKNKRGEFLETLNMTDILQMKAAAKTKNVWDTWFSEMVLKSVIKRACKRHFRDITLNIDKLDNENYDLGRIGFNDLIQKKIEETTVISDLVKLFKKEKNNVSDEVKFVSLLGERKAELMALLPAITNDDHPKALKLLQSGKKMDDLLCIWKIDEETQQDLISKAI